MVDQCRHRRIPDKARLIKEIAARSWLVPTRSPPAAAARRQRERSDPLRRGTSKRPTRRRARGDENSHARSTYERHVLAARAEPPRRAPDGVRCRGCL